jgi:hypothetical protein
MVIPGTAIPVCTSDTTVASVESPTTSVYSACGIHVNIDPKLEKNIKIV